MSSVTYIFRYQALNLLETNMYGDLNYNALQQI